jgi:hypothetical protein
MSNAVAVLSHGIYWSTSTEVVLPSAGEVWNGAGPFGVIEHLITPTRVDATEAYVKSGYKYGDPSSQLTGTGILYSYNPSITYPFWKAFTDWTALMVTPNMTVGSDLFAGFFPIDAPQKCTVVVFGADQVEAYLPYESTYSIQLVTRGKSYEEAEAEARRVYDGVSKNRIEFPLSGGWIVHSVLGQGGPRWTGMASEGDYQFTTELTVRVRQPKT